MNANDVTCEECERLFKIQSNEELLLSGVEAMRTVLNRPKNLEKPPIDGDLFELYFKTTGETDELRDELAAKEIDYEKTMCEASDACVYLFGIIKTCREALALKGEK